MENENILEQSAETISALGHVVRLQIVRLLFQAHPTGLVVGAIQEALSIPASTLSHHLDVLARYKLVIRTRESTSIRCTANIEVFVGLLDYLLADCCCGVVNAGPAAKGGETP